MSDGDQDRATKTFDQVVQGVVRPSLDVTLRRIGDMSDELRASISSTRSDLQDLAGAITQAVEQAADDGIEEIDTRFVALSAQLQIALAATTSSSTDRVEKMHADVVCILTEMRSTLAELIEQANAEAHLAETRQTAMQRGVTAASSSVEASVAELAVRVDVAVRELSSAIRSQRTALLAVAAAWVVVAVALLAVIVTR